MKKSKKLLSLILAATMLTFSLTACTSEGNGGSDDDNNGGDVSNNGDSGSDNSGSGDDNGDSGNSDVDPVVVSYDDQEIFDLALGEFSELYSAAKDPNLSISERFAQMAIAEAKMLESGIMIPLLANGGGYAISKIVPYTVTPIMYGSDNSRYHNAIIATEPLTVEDRDALKAIYSEVKGTGTYEEKAFEYLEEHGYETKRSYSYYYTTEHQTLDLFMTSKAVDSDVLVNTYDGLVEYDGEGVLQPALAESWDISDDGLTWTFHLRQGVKWVDSTGAEIAEVTADDFLAGFQHMLDDPTGGLSWLLVGIVKGVTEYTDPSNANYTTDFNDVGVKALDDYTVEYTLEQPCSYFETMLTYNPFGPMNRAYYESLGGEFGFANGNAGTYGTDKDHIAYCGPYLISSMIANNTITFTRNESYWNKDNINIDTITWIYIDGQIPTEYYTQFKSGNIDGTGLNTQAQELARQDGLFDDYAYVSTTGANSYPGFLNLNRRSFANYNNENALVSPQTEEDAELTHAALQSQNFRLAVAMAFDRGGYMEQTRGTALKYTSLVNAYTPGTFVAITEDTTVSINGTDKTFPAGTYYGEIMQAQIEADGYPMVVFDTEADGGIGSSGGYDGWYNPTEAAKYLDKAIAELAAAGYEISAENPVYLDIPFQDDGDVSTAMHTAVKQSIEEALGGVVIVNLVGTSDGDEVSYATYYYDSADCANYDIQLNSGWGPDYGDPSTYLDTMDLGGYMLMNLGLLL